jgi:hypothetical protein
MLAGVQSHVHRMTDELTEARAESEELQAVREELQRRDDDMGGGTVAEVVARVVAERDEAKARIAALEAGQVSAAVEMLRNASNLTHDGRVIVNPGKTFDFELCAAAHWLESQAKAPNLPYEVSAVPENGSERLVVGHASHAEKAVAAANYLETKGMQFVQVTDLREAKAPREAELVTSPPCGVCGAAGIGYSVCAACDACAARKAGELEPG